MEYVLPCKVSCGRCQSVIMDEGKPTVEAGPFIELTCPTRRPKHGVADADADRRYGRKGTSKGQRS